MTVEQLLSVISSHELAEWRAYFVVEAEDRERERAQADVKRAMQVERGRPLRP